MGHVFTVRITGALPVVVRGPNSRWRVCVEYYGKNGGRASLLAISLSHPGKTLTLADSRERGIDGLVRNGFQVQNGTVKLRLACLLVAMGHAEFVTRDASDPPFGFIYGK
jgi:hypothetical protein